MAGLYIHIPFCQSRCIYCAFYSSTQQQQKRAYVEAVCHEWQLRRHELSEPIETIYVGGGTPSQLSTSELSLLFSSLPTAAAREVTIECNPDDVTPQLAAHLLSLGVNRVSLGIQTFDDERLRFLRRRHSASQARHAVSTLREAGFRNISIDLMFGFPQQTLQQWDADISSALLLDVEHISAYCLTYEEGTPLYNIRAREGLSSVDEELERQMYYHLADRLSSSGYEHYELSNFARPTRRSLHNSNYWRQVAYLGLGAAAHSYDIASRSWNVSDIAEYIAAISSDRLPSGREVLDAATRYNDTVAVALRTSDGLSLPLLDEPFRSYCSREAARFISSGLLRLTADHHLRLTHQGLFVSDMVMSALMYVD